MACAHTCTRSEGRRLAPISTLGIRRRKGAGAAVAAGAHAEAVGGVRGLGPFAVHPHQAGRPRAMDPFVDQPDGDVRRGRGRAGSGGSRRSPAEVIGPRP